MRTPTKTQSLTPHLLVVSQEFCEECGRRRTLATMSEGDLYRHFTSMAACSEGQTLQDRWLF